MNYPPGLRIKETSEEWKVVEIEDIPIQEWYDFVDTIKSRPNLKYFIQNENWKTMVRLVDEKTGIIEFIESLKKKE